MDLFGPQTVTFSITKPESGQVGLKAGENKTGDNEYPLVKNLVENSLAHNTPSFVIGNSIHAVNGISMKGKTGHDVHEIVRNTAIGDRITFEIMPMGGKKMGSKASSGSFSSMTSMGASLPNEEDEESDGFGGFRRRSSLGDIDTDLFAVGGAVGGGETIAEDE